MAKIRVTNLDGVTNEYSAEALESGITGAMFNLQRQTGVVMPKGMQEAREREDVLTLTYYSAFMALHKAGQRPVWSDLIEWDVELVEEPTDTMQLPADDEADPTAAQTAEVSGLGESVAE